MAIHVAILKKPYLDKVLAGEKMLESRFTIRPIAPYQKIQPGERIFFKQSAGPFRATAIAGEVHFQDQLTSDALASIRQTWGPAIGGDDDYWQRKSKAKHASLIRLLDVTSYTHGPAIAPSQGLAWFVLPDEASPLLDITLSENAIKNSVIAIPKDHAMHQQPQILLHMPGGEQVQTDITSYHYLRYRKWRRYFHAFQVKTGDRLRLTHLKDHHYQVQFLVRYST